LTSIKITKKIKEINSKKGKKEKKKSIFIINAGKSYSRYFSTAKASYICTPMENIET
jgi:hypothetical protein